MASCEECNGECCRYVTVSYDTQKNEEDWDEIKWMLMHENIIVYQDTEGDWQVEFRTPCEHLAKDNKCKIYAKRPQVCRDHGTHECEANNFSFAKVIFYEPSDVDEYLKKR